MQTQPDIRNTAAAVPPALDEVHALMQAVRRLLVHSDSALAAEGVKDHAEALEHWLESYRRGLTAAQKLSKNSEPFLHEIRDRLKLAHDEMLRLEGEGGGVVASAAQRKEIDEMAGAIGHVDRLLSLLGEAHFAQEEEPEPA